jgi:hypothetical protein
MTSTTKFVVVGTFCPKNLTQASPYISISEFQLFTTDFLICIMEDPDGLHDISFRMNLKCIRFVFWFLFRQCSCGSGTSVPSFFIAFWDIHAVLPIFNNKLHPWFQSYACHLWSDPQYLISSFTIIDFFALASGRCVQTVTLLNRSTAFPVVLTNYVLIYTFIYQYIQYAPATRLLYLDILT